jgi:hypothetical protein
VSDYIKTCQNAEILTGQYIHSERELGQFGQYDGDTGWTIGGLKFPTEAEIYTLFPHANTNPKAKGVQHPNVFLILVDISKSLWNSIRSLPDNGFNFFI